MSGPSLESHTVDGVTVELVVLPDLELAFGRTPVTQAQWKAVMGSEPSGFPGPQRPVEQVSWRDAVRFCNRLSVAVGLRPAYAVEGSRVDRIDGSRGFRLPHEAEWERAAAPTAGDGAPPLEARAWFHGNAARTTHPVGHKAPNPQGLFDTIGNVWEWCADDHYRPGAHRSVSKQRVSRGGSWLCDASECAFDQRFGNDPGYRADDLGFRVCRSVAPPS